MSVHYSSKSNEWFTPQNVFDELNCEFGFDLDPCATSENAKCKKFFTMEQDGLAQDWTGSRVFCNPPYGRVIGKWVEKMATGGAAICVGLIPARTDTSYFHDHIYQKAEIRFIRGRLKFGGHKNSAPFPSMIVIWKAKELPATPTQSSSTEIRLGGGNAVKIKSKEKNEQS
jgi:site-specific DNA-methyltransferase (adenine-specific)